MEDFEEKLNNILSSPETMSQIMALADSLSGKPAAGERTQEGQEDNAAPPPTGFPDLSNLQENPLSLLSNLDPSLLSTVTTLYGEYSRGGDEKTALLLALRPFLKPERQAKLEKAVQITRLSRVIRSALRLFRDNREGGGYV